MTDWIRKQKQLLELEVGEDATLLRDKLQSCGGRVCEQEGLSIINLESIGVETTMFGRCSVEFQKIGKVVLPSGVKVGDEVDIVSNRPDTEPMFGLVKRITPTTITVIVDEYDDRLAEVPIRLNLHPSSKTHEKMMEALDHLAANPHPLSELLYSPPSTIVDPRFSTLLTMSTSGSVQQWFNPTLNPSQQNAINVALQATKISLVHGPPGTGKTSTLVELILQSLCRGHKLLVTAPSNIAVDTILFRLVTALDNTMTHISSSQGRSAAQAALLDKLSNAKQNLVRVGHPARIHPITQAYSLDARILSDEDTEIVQDVKKELDQLRADLTKCPSRHRPPDSGEPAVPPGQRRRELRQDVKAVRKELRQRETAVVERILARACVVFATCVGAASHLLAPLDFDLVLVDEAAQCLEAATWIPILRAGRAEVSGASTRHRSAFSTQKLGGRVVLAGDHCQLPPTVKSQAAADQGLAVTLFERFVHYSQHQPFQNSTQSSTASSSVENRFEDVICMLTVQYRMHDVINRWASRAMYQDRLTSHDSVRCHSLCDVLAPDVVQTMYLGSEVAEWPPTMLFIDTSGSGMHEDVSNGVGSSHSNLQEAQVVVAHLIHLLITLRLPCSSVGIITPYNGQVQVLKRLVAESSTLQREVRDLETLEIKTVDGFQGGEKECILLSLVRSQPLGSSSGRGAQALTVGFLRDCRRINVAVTRTKRHFVCVGDRTTCATDSFIKGLLDHCERYGDLLAVEDFTNGGETSGLLSCRCPEDDFVWDDDTITSTAGAAADGGAKESNKKSKQPKPAKGAKSQKPGNAVREAWTGASSALAGQQQKQRNEAEEEVQKQLLEQLLQALCDVTQEADVSGLQAQATAALPQLLPHHNTKQLQHQIAVVHDRAEQRVSLCFPAACSSWIRLHLHRLAETMSLQHVSRGEGTERSMEVSRLLPHVAAEEEEEAEQEAEEEEEEEEVKRQQPSSAQGKSKLSKKNKNKKKPNTVGSAPASSAVASTLNPEIASVLRQPPRHLQQQQQKKVNPMDKSLDIDAILDAAIAQNEREAELRKYRLTHTTAMPNYDKDCTRDKLRAKLQTAQGARKTQLSEEEAARVGGSNKKVEKKPPRNFGGGRVGGGGSSST